MNSHELKVLTDADTILGTYIRRFRRDLQAKLDLVLARESEQEEKDSILSYSLR